MSKERSNIPYARDHAAILQQHFCYIAGMLQMLLQWSVL